MDLPSRIHDPGLLYQSGHTTFFSARCDPRVSFTLYVPAAHRETKASLPLVVLVHGTDRSAEGYRNEFAEFAECHGCVVLCPLFPADGPRGLHNYKRLVYADFRYDQILLGIVDEVAERYGLAPDRFLLHGFSGGGHFAHRFLYLHPQRLAAASIGAPGQVTLLDPEQPWPAGIRDAPEIFGQEIEIAALPQVPVQMVVGAADTDTWEITASGETPFADAINAAGRTRIDRLRRLRDNFIEHGVRVRFDLVEGAAHEGFRILPPVREFFAEVLAASQALH